MTTNANTTAGSRTNHTAHDTAGSTANNEVPFTIESAGAALRAGTVSAVALTTAALAAADRLDPQLGTFLARFEDTALARAAQADAELAAGNDLGPLHGIPLGIKDILATDEGPTTAQSLVLDPSWGDQGDGPVVRRLRAAGAVIVGKTTTMEFAVGRPDFSRPFPVPRNPWNPERWTGGSSSGTGNGVASGQFLGGIGTDTGGSIRLPAAYNGISGHKPTYGLVPKSGCVPLGLTYDHIGPMARSVWDCAAMLNVLAGADPSDRTTISAPPPDYVAGLARPLPGLRLGVIANERVRSGSAPSTLAALDAAVAELVAGGALADEVELPLYDELTVGAFLALQAEAFAWHRATLATRWADYGRPTRLTLAQGALINAGDLVQVERVRQVARRQITDLLDARGIDVLVCPTAGYGATAFTNANPHAVSPRALHTPAWNGTGFPALSVPLGFDPDGLPLGLQIIGRPLADDLVLAVGHAYQQRTDWHLHRAPLHA
jgi:aspartyl-tRNA(Asn)/glutamyl-tRNA(Gln) amidotransferase subunit A